MNEVYIVRKRGKFLSGSSYATGLGHKYHWTHEPQVAQWFPVYTTALSMAKQCGGKVWRYDTVTRQATLVVNPPEEA